MNLPVVIVLFLICLAVTVPGLIFFPLISPEAAVAVPPMTMKSARTAIQVAGENRRSPTRDSFMFSPLVVSLPTLKPADGRPCQPFVLCRR